MPIVSNADKHKCLSALLKMQRRVRMKEVPEKELFETIPVPQAVMTLAIPTVISQVVTMIYNLADTFFITFG